jgi:hypothetical protein
VRSFLVFFTAGVWMLYVLWIFFIGGGPVLEKTQAGPVLISVINR